MKGFHAMIDAIDASEARDILESPDLIAIGVRADDVRRQMHGGRTTFVRVFQIHVGAPAASLPTRLSAGEFRIVGRPSSVDLAVGAVGAAVALAGGVPVTGFTLADLQALAGSILRLGLHHAPCRWSCRDRRGPGGSARFRILRRDRAGARLWSCVESADRGGSRPGSRCRCRACARTAGCCRRVQGVCAAPSHHVDLRSVDRV